MPPRWIPDPRPTSHTHTGRDPNEPAGREPLADMVARMEAEQAQDRRKNPAELKALLDIKRALHTAAGNIADHMVMALRSHSRRHLTPEQYVAEYAAALPPKAQRALRELIVEAEPAMRSGDRSAMDRGVNHLVDVLGDELYEAHWIPDFTPPTGESAAELAAKIPRS